MMRGFLTGFVLLLIFVSPIFADQPREDFFVPARISAEAAITQLKSETPAVQVYKLDQRVTKIYGHAFGSGPSPEATAEQFRLNHAEVLGAEPADLQPVSLLADGQHSIPIMYNESTGQYKFTLVSYSQYRDDIPVFRSDVRLLIRNEPNYPLVLATSALRYLGNFNVSDKGNVDFEAGKNAALSEFSSLTDFTKPRTVIWAGYNDEDAEPRLALEFTGYNDEAERWLFVTDASTGEILYKEDQVIFEDVTGTVKGYATTGTAADFCEPETIMPLPYARVNIGSTVAYTDHKGTFSISNAGTDSVAVESKILGQFFQVYNNGGSDAYLVDTVLPPGPVNFLHNSLNTSEYNRAEVNAYVYANVIRDLCLVYVPTYPGVYNQSNFPIYVNRNDGYCPGNAWYDNYAQSLNFCRASSPYPNTAWQSVIDHEYGHHLVNMAGSGQDQYGEGMSDCVCIMYSDESELGLGFYGDCSTPLRNADNSMQYPCNGEAHDCAGLLSGCIWDLRNELLATDPSGYRDTLRNLTFNSILLHTGSLITPQITIDYLTLDDNDADLDNGTPHYFEICTAFGNHSMDCPELTLVWFEYPDGRPEIITPNMPNTFEVIIHSGSVAPVSGSGELYYSVDGGPYTLGTMTETFPNQYLITLTGGDCGSKISWYILAEASGFGTMYDPSGAPTKSYAVVSATELVDVFSDDFQTNKGWTVSGSVTDGPWERAIPAGGGDRGDPPTDFDGSGYCYVTDNADDNSDVDGGTTILTSPMIDLSEGDASIHYARWYSNNYGADPNNDEMNIYISNNNGANWTLVETVGPVDQANGGWYEHTFTVSDFVTPTATVRMRFDASDLNDGSVVEAAIDDFTVKSYRCGNEITIVTPDLPDWTAGMAYSQQLEATGGVGAMTWTDKYTDLDGTGLILSASGLLSGTPLASGPVSFTAMVADESKATAEKEYSFTVNAAVVITTSTLPDWTAGQSYSQLLEAGGGTAPLGWTDRDTDLPGTGLTLASDGTLSGTPISDGTVSFTARATDLVGAYDDQGLSFTVNPAVDITITALPDATESTAYSLQLEATGGTGSRTWIDKNNDLSSTGLTLSSSGLLSGTPNDTGTISFTAQASDMTGSSDEQLLSLIIGPAFMCGDANADLAINIFDVTYIITYLYLDGPPPMPAESADVDNNGTINIFDITGLISFLYTNGADPVCP